VPGRNPQSFSAQGGGIRSSAIRSNIKCVARATLSKLVNRRDVHGGLWAKQQRVLGELLKSHGDGCLVEAATVLLPPV